MSPRSQVKPHSLLESTEQPLHSVNIATDGEATLQSPFLSRSASLQLDKDVAAADSIRADRFDIGVLLVSAALIASFVFSNVIWSYVSHRAGQTYAFSLSQQSSLMLVLLQGPYVLVQLYRGAIPWAAVRAIPLPVLLTLGLMDAVYDVFSSMGAPYTPAPLQTVLFQVPVPLTMALSYWFTRKRFFKGQYLGATIILLGCVLSVAPGVIDVIRANGVGGSGGNTTGTDIKPASVLISFVSVLFYSVYMVYSEYNLKTTLINVWFLSVATSSINFVVTFLLIPLLWIPTMGNDSPSNTFPHMWAGVRCVWGGVSTMDPSASCPTLWWLICLDVLSSIVINVLTLQLVRKGSALMLQAVSGVQLVLCNLFYAWTLVMTEELVVPLDKWMVRPQEQSLRAAAASALASMDAFQLPRLRLILPLSVCSACMVFC